MKTMVAPSDDNKRVLVTGSSGYTGKYLCRALEKQHYAVSGLSHGEISAYNHFNANLENLPQLIKIMEQVKPHYIIHLAGLSSLSHGQKQEDLYHVNVFGTLNLLQAIEDAHIQPEKNNYGK